MKSSLSIAVLPTLSFVTAKQPNLKLSEPGDFKVQFVAISNRIRQGQISPFWQRLADAYVSDSEE